MSSPQSLPDDPFLAAVAREINATRGAAMIMDERFRLVWVSDEFNAVLSEESEDWHEGIGRNLLENWMSEPWCSMITPESQLEALQGHLPYLMWHIGKDEVERIFLAKVRGWVAALDDPPDWMRGLDDDEIEAFVRGLVAQAEPVQPPPVFAGTYDFLQGDLPPMKVTEINVQLRDEQGRHRGTLCMFDPALPARVHAMVARGDEGMYERMARLVRPGRKEAAILFADLESSGALSRRLASGAYFRLIRELTTAIDAAVGERGGIIGKHAGDGITAFFLAEDAGGASAAARAAIGTARDILDLARKIAAELGNEIGLGDDELCRINVGLHWGARLYMGQLVTGGRLEVTALGDAVNECARVQESARGGRILASKDLVERLEQSDAAALMIDPEKVLYTTIAELPGAPDKARRDAGGLPVTPIS